MPTLHLLRHAKTEAYRSGHPDRDRRLTADGLAAAAAVGAHLRALGGIELVLTSPAVRTRQTVEQLELDAPIEVVAGFYQADPDDILTELAAHSAFPFTAEGAVLVVGHNPTIAQLALDMAAGHRSAEEIERRFSPGTLATLELDGSWDDLAGTRSVTVRRP